jgi:hypothetical protein
MRRIDLINKISSQNVVPSEKSMQVQDEQSEAYYNFINSLNSQSTRKSYEFCIEKFLSHYSIDLESLLKLPQQDISNLLIRYLVEKKISKSYKMQIFSALKHACEMNDVVLNWKKLKKFIKSEKTDNEISGKDRAYTHQEIQKILGFCDQRSRTAFLLLASTGVRIGARSLEVKYTMHDEMYPGDEMGQHDIDEDGIAKTLLPYIKSLHEIYLRIYPVYEAKFK